MMKKKLSPYIVGLLGLLGMIIFYFLLLSLITKDIYHPWFFFIDKWYFFIPLFFGFGLQMFLFQRLRVIIQQNNLKMMGATAGTNGVAMAACCAHHLAEVFPIIGFASAGMFMTKYQDWFLTFGVLMTIIGIFYMRYQLKKHKGMACCHSK